LGAAGQRWEEEKLRDWWPRGGSRHCRGPGSGRLWINLSFSAFTLQNATFCRIDAGGDSSTSAASARPTFSRLAVVGVGRINPDAKTVAGFPEGAA
jgi:hypothetical protein